ncbi:hypothetical protein [Streptomyces sp. JJ36]|uniref:hypothetical protein n=1 Tax=Streptomyces sp. JJ36 TaxID=2736645 RepID=UPI001F2B7392|nr:hypothetical protein [Streptomyces sp. JJ36]MCF6525930.1 hypothetical protein [Streptomyces sp. JJ36]
MLSLPTGLLHTQGRTSDGRMTGGPMAACSVIGYPPFRLVVLGGCHRPSIEG